MGFCFVVGAPELGVQILASRDKPQFDSGWYLTTSINQCGGPWTALVTLMAQAPFFMAGTGRRFRILGWVRG